MSEIVVVQGYAGSGKSTHSEHFSQNRYNGEAIVHVSAGTRLRAIRTGIEDSRHAAFINDPEAPSPLPDEIVNDVIFENANPVRNGLTLIDGYPRHETGVGVFERSLRRERHRLLGSVCLEVTMNTSVRRILSRGERDGERIKGRDLADYARRRYRDDSTQTQRAVQRLERIAPVERVDANASVEEVRERFYQAMGRLGVQLDGM
jgi:adenylate kinase family enzyme